jgi:hypothetical protein
MKRLLCVLFCLAPLLGLAGCTGVSEEKPSKKGPEMTEEAKKTSAGHIEEMRKMHQKK